MRLRSGSVSIVGMPLPNPLTCPYCTDKLMIEAGFDSATERRQIYGLVPLTPEGEADLDGLLFRVRVFTCPECSYIVLLGDDVMHGWAVSDQKTAELIAEGVLDMQRDAPDAQAVVVEPPRRLQRAR